MLRVNTVVIRVGMTVDSTYLTENRISPQNLRPSFIKHQIFENKNIFESISETQPSTY